MGGEDQTKSGHVFVLPLPVQGHINPILQSSKRLVSKGIKVTLFTTILASESVQAGVGSISVVPFSDGDGETGFESSSGDDFMEKIKIVVCKNLPEFAEKQERLGCPIKCLVYDSIMTRALPLAKQLNLIGAAFYTRSSAVSAIYHQVNKGLIPGSVTLETHDFPSFVYKPDVYPAILQLVLSRFSNIDEADWLLFNTYEKLEEEFLMLISHTSDELDGKAITNKNDHDNNAVILPRQETGGSRIWDSSLYT